MNKTIKQILAFALCLLMLLPILASCNKKKKGEDEPTVTPDGIVLLNTPVTIAGGDAVYTVARPQTSTDTYSACLTQLINIIPMRIIITIDNIVFVCMFYNICKARN